jgi:hypothetical protein
MDAGSGRAVRLTENTFRFVTPIQASYDDLNLKKQFPPVLGTNTALVPVA